MAFRREHEWPEGVDPPVSHPTECEACGFSLGPGAEPLPLCPGEASAQGGGLTRKKPLERRSRLREVAPDREEKRSHQRDEEFREYTRHSPSVVSGEKPCDPAHVYSWGAGNGDWLEDGTGNLVPLTRLEHQELHQVGRDTWEERHDLDLDFERVRHGRRFENARDG